MKEYSPAPEVEQIAEKLIEIFKPELEGFEIKYIFSNENPKKDGREVTALARKITGLNAYLAGCPDGFFVLEFGKPAFDESTENQVIAVTHHELMHFGINESGNLAILPHDIEEFRSTVEIFGAYADDITLFYHAVERGEKNASNRDEIIASILNG